jgi:hypothetical protein
MFVNSCSIQALLNAPNLDDPLTNNIVKNWKNHQVEDVATCLYLNWTLTIYSKYIILFKKKI